MPRRTDIESVCVIGSGPIVIGQACEFDYSGCQALKVLREDGFRSRSANSWLLGQTLRGAVVKTVAAGRVVHAA